MYFILVAGIIIFITIAIGTIIMANYIVGGIIIIAIGIGCFYLSKTNKEEHKQHISNIKHIETFKIKDIINICDITKEEMGTSGYFSMIVAVEGFVKGNTPQVYVAKEEFFGDEYTNVRIKNDQFYVEDDSGKILIKVDKIDVFRDNKGKELIKKNDPHFRVIKTKDIDGPIYVIGEATDRTGELVIQKPKDSGNSSLVAFTSKEIYLKQRGPSSFWYVVSGICFIIVGFLVLAGIEGFAK